MEINSETITLVRNHTSRILGVLHEYRYLHQSYIIEFFVKNHWGALPKRWTAVLDLLQPQEIASCLLNSNNNAPVSCRSIFPLSLLAFKATCVSLSLPRNFTTVHGEFDDSNKCQSKLLKHIFRKHVNPKKQHEIRQLSHVIGNVANERNIRQIVVRIEKCDDRWMQNYIPNCVPRYIFINKVAGVEGFVYQPYDPDFKYQDVGAGQGHLTRLLAFGLGMEVTSIEAVQQHITNAEIYDKQCTATIEKLNQKSGDSRNELLQPRYIPQYIEKFIMPHEYLRILSMEDSTRNHHHLLTGLHACGDLSATMIDTFVNCKEVEAIVSVACCYMKLSVESEQLHNCELGHDNRCNGCTNSSKPGYPLSKFLKTQKLHSLSYQSREISCHAIEKYKSSLQETNPKLKAHCYRAVLEVLLRKLHNVVLAGVQTKRKSYLKSFQEYAKSAFSTLNLPLIEDEVEDESIAYMLSESHHVVTYYTLCLLTAPLIETVILLDRAIYLYENGFNSIIKTVFDPMLSPRCFALTCVKGDEKNTEYL